MNRYILTYLVVTLFAAMVFAGCEKSDVDTTYVLRTYLETTLDREVMDEYGDISLVPVDSVISHPTKQEIYAYAFYADTAVWHIASVDDALAGIMTRKGGTETLEPSFTATPDASGEIMMGPFSERTMVLMVCDESQPDSVRYAWRLVKARPTLPQVTVSLTFSRLKYDEYKNAQWTMVNPMSPPSISFTASSATESPAATQHIITVNLSKASETNITFGLEATDQTTLEETDYSFPASETILAGETEKQITISLPGDSEGVLQIRLTLPPSGVLAGNTRIYTLTLEQEEEEE